MLCKAVNSETNNFTDNLTKQEKILRELQQGEKNYNKSRWNF